jgi:hypothetical protein
MEKGKKMDCHVANAPRNDDFSCFSVIASPAKAGRPGYGKGYAAERAIQKPYFSTIRFPQTRMNMPGNDNTATKKPHFRVAL